MSCEKCKIETKEAVKSSRLMSDMVQAYDKQNKRLWVAIVILASAFLLIALSAIWTIQNAQRIANNAVLDALNTVAEIGVTTETTTTEVTQDTGEGSGNNVYLDGDDTTYNEGGDN